MIGMLRVAAVVAGLTVMAGSAQAQDVAASRTAILSGDLSGAARSLETERRIFPNRQEVLLNLAAVYSATGRVHEAAALYRRVLDRRDTLLDLDDTRTASAHSIANRGLSRIAAVQTASR